MPTKTTLYALFSVPPGCTAAELHAAYKALALRHHPDKPGGSTAVFAQLTEAFAVLKSPTQRAQYDAKLKLLGGQCVRCEGRGLVRRQVTFTVVKEERCPACSGSGQAA